MRAGALPGTADVPTPRTSLVGRDADLAAVRRLLGSARLLTLTGPGGTGKTRLALAVAEDLAADHPGGVHVVPLAPVADPALVPVTIAHGVGLQDTRGLPILEHLARHLADGDRLLVLDNFEHLLPAADFVGALLDAGPTLRVLVTSRAPLHLTGEQEYAVPPLDGSAASALFTERAAAAVAGFTASPEEAAAVTEIVRRLDGLPLAVELAAARVKVLPPRALLTRLEDTPGLLVSDRRDVPDRQRTLRATVAWSHDLLTDGARELFAACSVFRGGIDLDRLAAVADRDLAILLPDLQELVDHSLLRQRDRAGAARFMMLETVREHATERLDGSPAADAVRDRHAAAFADLTATLHPAPCWPSPDVLDLLEQEHDNLRAALDRLQARDPGTALRMAARLTTFWSARGHFSEGRRRLHDLLRQAPADPAALHAMSAAAWLATDQGDRAEAADLLGRSIALAEERGDPLAEGWARFYRGRARNVVGVDPDSVDDLDRALALLEEAGEDAGYAATLMIRGLLPLFAEDLDGAKARFERAVAIATAAGADAVVSRTEQLLGTALLDGGDVAGARAVLARAVPAVVATGDRFGIPIGLGAVTGVAALSGRPRAALLVAGTAEAFEEVNQTHRPTRMRQYVDEWTASAREAVGARADALLEQGRHLALEEAVAIGLAEGPDVTERPDDGPLTRREAEVAALVARGLSNRDIARDLVLSVRTVESHVDHALTKLGLNSRTQLAAWVLAGTDR